MLKQDLIFRNPLRVLGYQGDDILPPGGFGAVLARAGVGKTALLVQLALDSLLQGRNVLHVSLSDPVRKVCLWYEEVFRNIATQCHVKPMDPMWEAILPHRLIMSFHIGGFSAPKLEERLADLAEQDIFLPRMILVDGMPFETSDRELLTDLKRLAVSYGVHVWFAVRTHRHHPPGDDGIPALLAPVADLFDVALELQPEGKNIYVRPLKGQINGDTSGRLLLDPATLLIRDLAEEGA